MLLLFLKAPFCWTIFCSLKFFYWSRGLKRFIFIFSLSSQEIITLSFISLAPIFANEGIILFLKVSGNWISILHSLLLREKYVVHNGAPQQPCKTGSNSEIHTFVREFVELSKAIYRNNNKYCWSKVQLSWSKWDGRKRM